MEPAVKISAQIIFWHLKDLKFALLNFTIGKLLPLLISTVNERLGYILAHFL